MVSALGLKPKGCQFDPRPSTTNNNTLFGYTECPSYVFNMKSMHYSWWGRGGDTVLIWCISWISMSTCWVYLTSTWPSSHSVFILAIGYSHMRGKNLKSLKVPNETTEQMDIDILCESGVKKLPSTVQVLSRRTGSRGVFFCHFLWCKKCHTSVSEETD